MYKLTSVDVVASLRSAAVHCPKNLTQMPIQLLLPLLEVEVCQLRLQLKSAKGRRGPVGNALMQVQEPRVVHQWGETMVGVPPQD